MDVNLVMFKRNGERKDIPLNKTRTIIGRRDDCDLRVPLVGISRQHCEIVLEKDSVVVKDLASSNGTFVNNSRVTEQALSPGDRILIGPVVFTVQIDGQPAQVAPAKPEAQSKSASTGEDDAFELIDEQEEGDEDPIDALEALAQQPDEDED